MGVTFKRATGDDRPHVLALLLTGRASGDEAAVGSFVAFAGDHHLSIEGLWAAWRGDTPIAAMLIVPSPGRTAMVFVSPMTGSATQPVVTGLARVVCATQDLNCVTMLQSLLDLPQHREAQALATAGFERLAELIYMQRPADAPEVPLQLDSSLELVHWSDQHRGHFADAIMASYEQTLDCPGLVGLRQIDDIIAGHKATGEFSPNLWFALRCDDQPVAVMLLNVVPRRQSMELVYLGVSATWRGRGIGRRLLAHGLGLAGRQKATNIILAVDQRNKPALRLYRSLRFTSTTRKLAMIYNLGDGCAGSAEATATP